MYLTRSLSHVATLVTVTISVGKPAYLIIANGPQCHTRQRTVLSY